MRTTKTTLRVCVRSRRTQRRGAVAAMTVVSSGVLVGFAALAIDVGRLYNAKEEMQRTADATALAGAAKVLDKHRLMGTPDTSDDRNLIQAEISRFASLNKIGNTAPAVSSADVLVGYLTDPTNLSEPISTSDPNLINTVRVTIRRDSTLNGPIGLWFAQIFGIRNASLTATAAATFKDGVTGWRVTAQSGNAELLPLALHVNAWNNLINRAGTVRDNYNFNETTRTISSGADGIPELNLYPGAGPTQLPPGNFGTVDIGSPNNSTADLSRQIRYGVSAEDLMWFGGELKLGPDGTLLLNGDTGLSAGIKDDLEAIKGLPRAIPLFRSVTGPGNNSMFTVVGFAGIRILNVRLTGAMNSKEVVIQPAFVVDDAVITSSGAGPSYFIYKPVTLTR